MKHFTNIQYEILKQLQDGACHSGGELGKALKVSRTTIWKHINQLIQFGIPINCMNKQGYQLNEPFIMLRKSDIHQNFESQDFKSPIQLHLFASIDSTNTFLKNLPPSDTIEICCSEKQTAGRGRFNRNWNSPAGKHVYCSIRWQFSCDLSRLSGLSLVASLAVVASLKQLGIHENIAVKWPNDILWLDKKLCGILIEIMGEPNGNTMLIIGFGINVNELTPNLTTHHHRCSLLDIGGTYHNRNQIIASVLIYLNRYLNRFLNNGFQDFYEEWKQYDYLFNKSIRVNQFTTSLSGTAKGVSTTGQLILEDENNILHHLSSGDTSLHFGEQ